MTQPPSAEDAKAGIAGVLNHIPATMQATRGVLAAMASIGQGVPPGGDLLQDGVNKLLPSLIQAVMLLENRVEVLEGRPGVPLARLAAIAAEFGG